MSRKILFIVLLTIVLGIFIPSYALAANNNNSGEITIDNAWSGSLQNEITVTLGASAISVTKLSITAGTITDTDVNWISQNLSNLIELNISGGAAFEDNDLPLHSFSALADTYKLDKLQTVTIDPTNSSLNFPLGSFFETQELTTINIPCEVTFANNTLFKCSKLTTVNMDNAKSFGSYTFCYAPMLESISLPSATTFGDYAFAVCDTLSTIELPEATTFGSYAFQNGKVLVDISLPKATDFGTNAFNGCTTLETISLPSMESAGSNMFMGTKTGISMTLGATPPAVIPATFSIYSIFPQGANIQIPDSAIPAYEAVNDGGKNGWYGFIINPPTLVSTNPANDTTGVDCSANLILTFSEDVVTGTGTIVIKKVSDNSFVSFITATNSSQLSTSGNQAIINPSSDLPPNTALYVEIPNTAIKDKSGDPYTGITGATTWNFTTNVPKYRVYYNGNANNSGTPPEDTTQYESGKPVTVLGNTGNLAKTGYTFDGWNTYSNGNGDGYTAGTTYSMGATDATLYAKWTVNQYTISFDEDGGSNVNNITQDYNTTINVPVCNKTGYYVEGWYTEDTFDNKVTFPYTILGHATLYANWEVEQYTINFDEDDGSNVNNITQNYNTTIDTSPITTKSGHTFEGWYTDDYTFYNKVTFPYTIVYNATLYAKWEAIPYTISFDVDEGSSVNDITQDYNTTINAPVCNKTGHYLEGWYTEDTFNNKVTFPYTILGNAIFYAKWEIEQYTISFDVDDGTVVNPIIQNYNTTIDSSPVTTKTGYEFDGWYKEDTFNNKVAFPYTITSNAMLYAKWEEIKVGEVSFSSSNEKYNIGITGSITVNITPNNANNQNITISNLNSNVASAIVDSMDPYKIWITALEEGRTVITVTTADGSFTDTCVIVVVSPDTPPPSTPQGGIVGALIDDNGDPLVGYYITLHSTPVTVVTDSNGKFSFPNIQFTSHTMIVESPARSELARFAVSMVQGSNTASTVNNIINSIDITYANTTLEINVDLQAANPMGTDFNIAQVGFTNKTITAPVSNGRVENPATGEVTDNTIYKLISMLIVIVLLLMYYSFRRYKMNIKS